MHGPWIQNSLIYLLQFKKKHQSLNVVVVKPLSTMNIFTPRLTPWYSHDPVKSRSDIRHCAWTVMTALTIMIQTRYSKEQKHSYTTRSSFSGREGGILTAPLHLHYSVAISALASHCYLRIFMSCTQHWLYFVKKFATDILRCFSLSLLRKLLFIRSFSFISFLFSHISRFCSFQLYSDAFWTQTSGVLQQVQWYVIPYAENLSRQKSLCSWMISPSIANFRFTDLSVVFF